MAHRKKKRISLGRKIGRPLSRPADVLIEMARSPLMKTCRADTPIVWGLANGREVTEAAARRLISTGQVVPRDPGFGIGEEAQTFVLPPPA